ncbi:hypothetical protein [Leptospira sarikeiensis]|uniref:Uncharacterized protein n=1 Tax=Leptospira sarikeiensis TaxID=2484943 RepID=A0A4R9K713_9LEPT|nr:hypothetical protein [Leptospira sarikeiensis]TGL61160.1 hypothetical protein EHQ64_11110 [Leptospira sarikeiensis]
MTREELLNYLRTEFRNFKQSHVRNPYNDIDDLDFFIESCNRNGINSISELQAIVGLDMNRIREILEIMNPTTMISELAYHVAIQNYGFCIEGFLSHQIGIFYPNGNS